jgi:prophage regulatory protein
MPLPGATSSVSSELVFPSLQILRPAELYKMVRLHRTTIYRLERAKLFPAHIRLGPRAIGWRLSDILAWLDSRAANQASAAGEVGK